MEDRSSWVIHGYKLQGGDDGQCVHVGPVLPGPTDPNEVRGEVQTVSQWDALHDFDV